MIKRFFILLLAIVASVGMMNAKVTWNRSNISDLDVHGTYASYSKESVTLRLNADEIYARWYDYGDESNSGIGFNANATGGFTFSNTLDKNFTKIEMTLRGPGGWDMANLGSGWNIDGDPWDVMKAIWTGNASTVDLAKDESHFNGDYVKSIVFYFEGDSQEATTAVTGVTLNKSAAELTVGGATLTLIPTVLPSNATNKEVMWNSDNGYVAVVENGGVVIPVGPGTANITVITVDGDYSATCVVTVSNPAPTYTVALKAGTANADKVTLSATSAAEGATVTVTPDDEYEITAFSAYYVVVEDQLGSIYDIDATLNAETGAYSFTMPAYAVTIEATIAAKPVPEGDIYAGFTATAGAGGFSGEDYSKLVDGKFISSDWTKWCANDGHKSVPTGESESCWWIDFEASAALYPTGYILTTGNDSGSETGRNPKNWVLKAKLNAGDAWTTIATVTNDVTMKNKSFKDYKFFVDQSGSYKYFRFEVFANQGASVMQLCQLRLIGTDAPAAPATTPAGALNGAFTINANGDKIVFSRGNLQAKTTDLGANWTWDFAPNQWSLIGNAVANNAINGNKKVSANGTVDLFGWSTAATYYGIHNSWKNDDYTGDFVDWGALMGTEWRTLSRAEFYYIVYSRTEAYKKRGQATVNGVPGYVLLPDAWTLPSGLSFTNGAGNYTTNLYDGADWTAMENAGAVFLPAAGVREGTDIYQVNLYGWYWASTPNEEDGGKAYYLYFDKSSQGVTEYHRWKSKSVRLVTAAPIPAYEAVMNLINAIGTVELTAECKAKIDAARTAYDALSDGDKGQVTNYSTLTDAETAYANAKQAADQAAAAPVIAKINALPNPVTAADTKLSVYTNVQDARAAYDALTDDQKALVSNIANLTAAENAFAPYTGGGGMPADALNGKFTINAGGDQIAFAKGNLQATTEDLGEHWTWSFAANQWNYLGIVVANSKINGNGTVSENGTVDLFGWSTAATYYGINNSYKAVDYIGDFVDWGSNMGAGWRTLTKDEWNYLIENNTKGRATVNDKSGYIFLPDNWSGPAFTPDPDNFTTNVYSGDDWTAMENAGAVFLPSGPARNGAYALIANDAKYSSSTSLNKDTSYVFTIYYNQSQSACTGTNRAYGCMVRLVTAGGASPIAAAQAAVDLINAIPDPVTLDAACVKAIKDAREAVTALGEASSLIDAADMTKLTKAEADYTALIQAGADAVTAKIAAIPQPVTLKLATRDSIESARAAYDALTADQKALVTNYPVLTAAEATMAGLNPGGGAPLPEGALTGAFSINADGDKIAFSKGNLQATTANLGETWTWAFAAHQYDYVGNAVANTAITGNKTVSTNGTIDLFGWSTAATYYGINNSNVSGKHPGDFIDWGETIAEGWRTLTRDEWNYLLETRTDAASKYGHATVAGIHGIIVLPDSYKGTAINADHSDWSNNIISAEDWAAYEANGVAFLPAAGSRLTTNVNYVGEYGMYWTSTTYYEKFAYRVRFLPNLSPDYGDRVPGHSVRLVTAHTGSATPLDSAQAVKDLIEAIPVPVTLDDACVNAVQAARDAYNALTDATKDALDDATVQKLNQAITDYTALIQAGADEVIAKINNIPSPVTLKLATRDSIESARAAYDALTADQKPLVSNYQTLLDAEAAWATLNPGGGMPAGALSGKFTINADGDQISFAKGNLQATTTDLGETWTWGFAANQWDFIGNAAANNAISGNGTVSANGTVDLFGWSTPTTYYGIHNSANSDYYSSEFREWGENITGAEWKTLSPSDWIYIISNRADAAQKQGQATVNGVNGYIFLPDEWELPTGLSFTAKPNNWTANVYDGADWTAMENAGAVFLPKSPWRSGNTINTITYGYYWSSDYNNYSNAMAYYFKEDASITGTGTPRYAGICVRLVTAGAGSATPLDSALAVKDLIETIPAEITLDAACVKAIEDARAAYDALSEAAQGALDAATVKKLTDAEKALKDLNQAEADKVIAKINNIPLPVELKLATRDSINNARAAYDALNAAQQALVSNIDVLTNAEAALAALNPGVPPATPLDSAQAVKDLIDAIPTPVEYPTSGPAIAAALVAYQQLSDAAKGALDDADKQKMTDAAAQFAALDAIAAIEAIPTEIVYDPLVKTAIETARDKFDALIDASKALVDAEVVAKLTNAEKAWADLVAKVEHNVSYIGKDAELKHETVALLHIPDPAPELNGFEFDEWRVNAGDDFLQEGVHIQATYSPIITTDPAAYDTLVYNGLAQELVKAGVAKEGHIEYSLYPEEPESWSAELPKATIAGVYAIYYKLVREGHADYIASEPTMATIAKVPVTYVAPVAVENLVYNASNQTLIAAGQTNDGTFEYSLNPALLDSWSTELPQAMAAGTYSVYYRVQGDINHLDSTAVDPIAVTIAKAELTATADDKTVIYGDAVPAYTVTYAGWQGDDDATAITGDIAFACEYAKGSPVGEYVITPSGVDAANYTITFVNGKVTVNRKSAKSDDITAKQADNEMLVYTAAVNKPTIQAKDTTKTLIEGTDYTLSFVGRGETQYAESATAPIHVGDYTAIVAFVGNYKDTLTVDFAIAKAPLTITAENKEVIFGENAPVFTVAYTGFLGTDTATVLTGTQAYACEYVRGDNVGDYTIIPSGVDAHDYVITFANGTLTVNRKSAKDADIVAAQLAGEKLIYTNAVNRPTIVVTDTTLQLTETKDYTLSFMGTQADNTQYAESATAPIHVGNYTAIVAFVGNYKDTLTVDFMINQAPLTITANDTAMIYGDDAPAFTVRYDGFLGTDDNSVLLGTQGYSCSYAPGSPIGTYAITPKDVTAYDYEITFVDGTLTVNKAHVYVSGAKAQIAKFADGHANAVVLEQGILNGIKLNDPIAHVTTAAFSSADVAENLTITLFYELTGDAALLNNYHLDPTSDIFTTEGVIIEPFIPDDQPEEKEDEETTVEEGIEIYAYGYCDGSGYSLKYHLESGNPDQYKIDFADSRFTDVDWTNLVITGKDGTIDIDIPVDLPTGDYDMTVYFRDSRFDWLESRQFNVTFHVNLPETYVRPLFDNVIALVDTCNCLTDIQWYWRANSTDTWVAIPGANGYYYHSDTKLEGEYFVSAKMNGEPTYTCGQADMETLYGNDNKQQNVQVKAYPNPVVTTTIVTIEGSENFDHNLRVVNLTGVEVLNTTFEGNETTVDMNGYVTGNYMISVDGIVVKVMKK